MLFPKEGQEVIHTVGGTEFNVTVVQVPKNPLAMVKVRLEDGREMMVGRNTLKEWADEDSRGSD